MSIFLNEKKIICIRRKNIKISNLEKMGWNAPGLNANSLLVVGSEVTSLSALDTSKWALQRMFCQVPPIYHLSSQQVPFDHSVTASLARYYRVSRERDPFQWVRS